MRPALVLPLVAAAAAAAAYALHCAGRRAAGSQTNASDAVSNVQLGRKPSSEQVMDAGVQQTFPASDPVSVENAFDTAYEREKRRGSSPAEPADLSRTARNPDWLLGR